MAFSTLHSVIFQLIAKVGSVADHRGTGRQQTTLDSNNTDGKNNMGWLPYRGTGRAPAPAYALIQPTSGHSLEMPAIAPFITTRTNGFPAGD